jgi:hypothetical protein
MPLSWNVLHPHRLVIAIAKGEVDPQEVHRYLQALADHSAQPYRKMFDLSLMTNVWSDAVVRSFASVVRDHAAISRLGPIAIIAASWESERSALVFARAATVDRPIRIFCERYLARRWLNEFVEEEQRRSRRLYEVWSRRSGGNAAVRS